MTSSQTSISARSPSGTIPASPKDNPGVNLPDKAILPVYRSEGSGTTFIFTDFLSKVNPDCKRQVGEGAAVKWPTGIGQKGNEGVAGMVRQTPYSFGYVELIYAVAEQDVVRRWSRTHPASF